MLLFSLWVLGRAKLWSYPHPYSKVNTSSNVLPQDFYKSDSDLMKSCVFSNDFLTSRDKQQSDDKAWLCLFNDHTNRRNIKAPVISAVRESANPHSSNNACL